MGIVKCKECEHDCHCNWDACDCGCDVCHCGRTITEDSYPSELQEDQEDLCAEINQKKLKNILKLEYLN